MEQGIKNRAQELRLTVNAFIVWSFSGSRNMKNSPHFYVQDKK